jgi:glutamine synthetase
VSDAAGMARGKIISTEKFIQACEGTPLLLAESVFAQDVQGRVIFSDVISELEPDIQLLPDLSTLRVLPWRKHSAMVICDTQYCDGKPLAINPRQVLQNVLANYSEQGGQRIVAPEFEFYIVYPSTDANQPLQTPVTRSGLRESGGQTYGMDGLRDFSEIIDTIYHYCAVLGVDVDVLTHEAGPGQFELNIQHGDPLALADQVLMFKRAAREAAYKHGLLITFMAKAHQGEPGNAMHIHQSVVAENGKNIFANEQGDTDHLYHYLGGLQKYTGAALSFYAPFVNSYRRFVKRQFAPVNTHWSGENRTVGLRLPDANTQNRRVENRVIGADANPYLAFAATLACGFLGMQEKIKPSKEMTGSAYESNSQQLPLHLLQATDKLKACKSLRTILGEDFCRLYVDIKLSEHNDFLDVITPWERQVLLATV